MYKHKQARCTEHWSVDGQSLNLKSRILFSLCRRLNSRSSQIITPQIHTEQ